MSSVASPEGLIHLGMDTSKNTIMVATLLPGEDSPVTDRIFNEEEAVRRLIGRFADRSVLRCCYEAGPGGYDLYRLLAAMGVACDVVAPSLIPKGTERLEAVCARVAPQIPGIFPNPCRVATGRP
jgi:transposase